MNSFISVNLTTDELTELIKSAVSAAMTGISTPEPIEPKRLIGDRAAADHLGCTPLTVAKLRKSGQISYYRYGRKYYYLANELDAAFKVSERRFGENRRTAK